MPNLSANYTWKSSIKEALENPVAFLEDGKYSDCDFYSKIEDWEKNREYEIDRLSNIVAKGLPSNVKGFLSVISQKDFYFYWVRVYYKIEE